MVTQNEEVFFCGCQNGLLTQHSVETMENIGEPLNLDAKWLSAIDQLGSFIVVAGFKFYRLIKLTKLKGKGKIKSLNSITMM